MEVWDAVREERLGLADRLSALDAEQWNSPSLCSEWRIRDVLGHVTAGAQGKYGFVPFLGGMARHGFNFNRWIASDGQERGKEDPAVTLKALRDSAGNRKAPPGAPKVSVLTDVLIHSQDMYRPLGIGRQVPEEHLLAVADFVSSSFVFGAKKRTAGLRLRANDMEWSRGDGPEVLGPAEALVMVMAGRLVALGELTGEGKPVLESRYR